MSPKEVMQLRLGGGWRKAGDLYMQMSVPVQQDGDRTYLDGIVGLRGRGHGGQWERESERVLTS